jgi:DNA-binding MarR family transcriptional regulator
VSATAATRPKPAPGYDYKTLLTYRLLVLSNTLGKGAVRFYARRFRIPLAEWRLVAALALHAAITVNALSAELSVDKGWVSRTAASLIKKGLVRGQTDARDGRKLLLTLTREGRALYAKVVPEARRRQSHLLAALSTDERRVFEAALEKLQNRASEMLTW